MKFILRVNRVPCVWEPFTGHGWIKCIMQTTCRGLSLEGNFLKRMKSYASVIQPLLLKSLGRSETMALSLELRGFGGPTHSFAASVGLKTMDYAVIGVLIVITILLFAIV